MVIAGISGSDATQEKAKSLPSSSTELLGDIIVDLISIEDDTKTIIGNIDQTAGSILDLSISNLVELPKTTNLLLFYLQYYITYNNDLFNPDNDSSSITIEQSTWDPLMQLWNRN